MIIEAIIQIGNPIFSKKCKPVTNIHSQKTKELITDLVDSMHHYNLVGIAAPQIGKNLRIFVTELRKTPFRNIESDRLRVFINPRIVWYSKREVEVYEGCGSVAYSKLFAPVKRSKSIIIEAFDEVGNPFRFKAEGFLSGVIQHEYDHLEGIAFTEKITDMRKIMSSEEYRKRVTLKSKK